MIWEQQLAIFKGEHYAGFSAVHPSLSPSVVEGAQLSHHPLVEEGWAGRGRGEPYREDTLH